MQCAINHMKIEKASVNSGVSKEFLRVVWISV